MAIQNFFTSRDNNLDGNTNVGQLGRLWYNPDTNSIYASDGVTAGGIPVDLATGANITANVITVNTITSTSGTVAVTGSLTTAGLVTATGNVTTANTFVGNLSGLVTHRVFNAGTIADAGTLTIDFSTEDLVYCVWNNGLTIAANNFTAGRVVRVMATKGTGSGTDSITLSGFTASHTSTGTLSQSYGADVTAIIEFISTDTTIGGVYIKL